MQSSVVSLLLVGLCAVLAPVADAAAPQDPEPVQEPAQESAQNPGEQEFLQGPVAQDPTRQELPILTRITVEGERRWTESQLIAPLGQTIGKPIDYEAAERGVETLWKFFKVRARILGRPEEGGVELLLIVEELAVDLEPRFIGNQKFKNKRLLEWALLDEESELYLHQSAQIRQRLINGYHSEGYHFVEVREVVRGGEGSDESPDVIFEIHEGPRVRVNKLIINGNESLPDSGAFFWKNGLQHLSKVKLKTNKVLRWWWPLDWINPMRWGRGKLFVEETLAADLLAMRKVYRERGWRDAVVELDRLRFSKDHTKVDIHVIIDEGEPYNVGSVDLECVVRVDDPERPGRLLERPGEFSFPEEELLELLSLEVGQRFEDTRVQADRIALRNYFGKLGYLSQSSLDPRTRWEFLPPRLRNDPQTKEVHVVYRVAQGQQRFVREVLFNGGARTRDRVLRREVRVFPGERADITDIETSLRRLTGTGYFSHPTDPEHRDPYYRVIPTDDPDQVDLEFVLQEGRDADFNFGGSVSSDGGVAGFVSMVIPNFDITDPPGSFFGALGEIYRGEAFRGAGQRLEVTISPGSVIDFWNFHFREPDLFRSHFNPWSLDLLFQKRDRIYESHDEERTQFTPSIGRRFGDHLSLTLSVTTQDIELTDVEDDEPVPQQLTNQANLGESDLQGSSLALRYRNLDSRLRPREGMSVTWTNSVFGGAWGGDFEYVKSDVRLETYGLLGDPLKEVRPGWHVGVWGGVADPFGDSDEVPYSERFYLGGSRSLRGFSYRGVGPNDGTDFPVGGETYARASFEYRLPLRSVTQPGSYRQREMFHLVLFTDWGVLDPDPFTLDLDELRGSVGFGFGLQTPIAPLRFDFGFPVESDDGDDERVFSFSFGL